MIKLSPWNSYQTNVDFLIIGAGIIGLSAAIHIKQTNPKASVLVLERGVIPMGATTRSAGFACFGSLTEILSDYKKIGPLALQQCMDRYNGIQELRKLLGDEAIDYKSVGNFELIGKNFISQINEINKVNNSLINCGMPKDIFSEKYLDITTFNFSKEHVKSLIFNRLEGQLNSGKLNNALVAYANHLGVKINYGSCATSIINNENFVDVLVESKNTDTIVFKANKVAICVNGNTNNLLPNYKIKPARTQVLLTKPLKNPILFTAPCHMEQGFYYFRSYEGNRILFGGGRNLDFEAETTTKLNTTPKIMQQLEKLLKTVIIPGEDFEIETRWAGTMGFSETCLPIIEKVKDTKNLVIGFACNGMGIARGVNAGKETAKILDKI